MCRLPRNSGVLNLLEPSGPVQLCIRSALPYREINSFIRSKEIYDNLSYYQIRNKYCHNTTLPYRTFAHRFMIFLIFFFKSKA